MIATITFRVFLHFPLIRHTCLHLAHWRIYFGRRFSFDVTRVDLGVTNVVFRQLVIGKRSTASRPYLNLRRRRFSSKPLTRFGRVIQYSSPISRITLYSVVRAQHNPNPLSVTLRGGSKATALSRLEFKTQSVYCSASNSFCVFIRFL